MIGCSKWRSGELKNGQFLLKLRFDTEQKVWILILVRTDWKKNISEGCRVSHFKSF